MVYIPPSYEQLQQSTRELQQTFNKAANRYEPPAYETLLDKILKMQKHYCSQVKEKKNLFFAREPDSVRFEEIACIVRLMDSFPPTSPGSLERRHAHNILLGALFYRRKAIEDSYHGSVSSCLGISNERYSALYLTIEDMLGLQPERRRALDTLSIATCCRAYSDHLKSIDAKKRSLYVRPEEIDFLPRLEALIDGSEGQSSGMTEQLNCLETIQVIGELLNKTYREVRVGLDALSASVLKVLVTKEVLSREEIIKMLQAMDLSPWVRAMIDYLIADDKTLTQSQGPLFIEEMVRNLTVYNQYTLLGAYVLAVNQTPMEHIDLKKTLYMAMNAVTIRNALDDEARMEAICALNDYLSLPGMQELCANSLPNFESMRCELRLKVSEFHSLQDLTTSVAAFNS